jgi:hypothetical protein
MARFRRRCSRTTVIVGSVSQMAVARSHASAGSHDDAFPVAVLHCCATMAAGGTEFSTARVRTARKVENMSLCLVKSENETNVWTSRTTWRLRAGTAV